MSNVHDVTPQDQLDFSSARTKAFMRSMLGLVAGHKTDLMAWDEVKDKLRLRGLVSRGIVTVPISQIVGSVGRYRDFDSAFLPTRNVLAGRWRKINRAFYDDISLPPVKLYKVGDVYFVLDGNHRVSVAREHGATFIDAEVSEAITRVPPTTKDINADTLAILGEYTDFLERTRLDKLRPDQNVRFSIGGGYERLIEHIAVHRYFMGLDLKHDISEDGAVTDWYDNVYMPIVKAVREENILKEFPGRTEADMYVWIIDHLHFLREGCSCDISAEQATADYAEHYGSKPALKRVRELVSHWMHSIVVRARARVQARA
jgi:hypothetical protein